MFWTATSVLILQMLCGINAILLLLFQLSIADLNHTNYYIIIASVNTISLWLYLACLYKVSSKILLVGGLLLMSSCEASAFTIGYHFDGRRTEVFTIALSCFFVFIFELSIGPIAWI